MQPIGRGQVVSRGGVEGILHQANTVEEVFALLPKDNLDEVILLTDSPSATAVVPLLSKVRGVVCRSGGMTSHLAIVAREFGLACIMGADLIDSAEVEGVAVTITEEGEIVRA